jgi:hypothetical protein
LCLLLSADSHITLLFLPSPLLEFCRRKRWNVAVIGNVAVVGISPSPSFEFRHHHCCCWNFAIAITGIRCCCRFATAIVVAVVSPPPCHATIGMSHRLWSRRRQLCCSTTPAARQAVPAVPHCVVCPEDAARLRHTPPSPGRADVYATFRTTHFYDDRLFPAFTMTVSCPLL